MHWLINLIKELGLILCILARLQMSLVPAFGPGSGVMLEADVNLWDPEVLIAANLFETFCALKIHCRLLSSHIQTKKPISATDCCDTWIDII